MKPVVIPLLVTAIGSGFVNDPNLVSAQTWTQTSAPTTNWTSIASSADGKKLVAAASNIWVSSDSGITWTQTGAPTLGWQAVACSADGMNLVAVGYLTPPLLGVVYTSTNSGVTWTSNNVPNVPWKFVISSADGSILGALTSQGVFYTSADAGADWIANSLPSGTWFAATTSADGSTFVVSGLVGICISTNSGTSWTLTNSLFEATTIAASASANRLVAVTGGSIYTSTNSGFAWTQTTAPVTNWASVASSADGVRLVAVAGAPRYIRYPPPPILPGGPIYTSRDSGLTWVSNNVPSQLWSCVASSADGTKLFAAVSSGGIWTSQSTPAPQMNITPTNGNLALSWIIPSTNLVLQQNSDLSTTNWTDVSNTPVLNFTNLQDEVTLPLTNGSGFYRLATP